MTDHFNDIADEITGKGAQYCDLYLQSSVAHSVRYEDKKIAELSSVVTEGTGARVVTDGKSFFAHRTGVSSLSAAEALNAALEPSEICGTTYDGGNEKLLEKNVPADKYPVDFLHDIDAELRRRSPAIQQISFRFSQSDKDILIIGPDGLRKNCSRKYTSFAAQIVAEKDGQLQTASERRCMTLEPSAFWEGAAAKDIADAAFDRAMLMLEAKPCPAGKMNVFLAGEAGGTIIHEACGHGLEADIVEKDSSVFKGRLGQRVASELVTMVDDPTICGLYGSYEFDDEGTEASSTLLIENGILKGYLTDRLSASLYGYPATGNGRRQSYRKLPIPRMSNTFLLPGAYKSVEEMCDIARNGLYVKKMGGGEVNPTTGDFVFYVAEAYIIRGGKIKEPVKGATLTGNGPEVLKNICALGDNLVMDPGICGKSGQSVPVTDGQPSMVVKGITVGGREV